MPPQNLEAEQSVLGSILLDNDVYAQIEGDHYPGTLLQRGTSQDFSRF